MFSAESQSIICCNRGGQRMLRSMYNAIVWHTTRTRTHEDETAATSIVKPQFKC